MGIWRLTKLVVGKFYKDDCFYLAAGIAYYSLFSAFPLLLAMVAALGWLLGPAEAQARVAEVIADYLPVSADLLAGSIQGSVVVRDVIGVVGVLGLLWSALSLFSAIRRALNRVWGVQWDWRFARRRLLELATMTGTGLLFVLSMAISTGIRLARLSLPADAPAIASWHWAILAAFFSFGLVFATFFIAYAFLPRASIQWSKVWPGALLAALVYEGAKYLFLWYVLNIAKYSVVYGPVAAVIVFLLWVYIAALIFLFGAELACALSRPRPQPEL
jgi:membrane protein